MQLYAILCYHDEENNGLNKEPLCRSSIAYHCIPFLGEGTIKLCIRHKLGNLDLQHQTLIYVLYYSDIAKCLEFDLILSMTITDDIRWFCLYYALSH